MSSRTHNRMLSTPTHMVSTSTTSLDLDLLLEPCLHVADQSDVRLPPDQQRLAGLGQAPATTTSSAPMRSEASPSYAADPVMVCKVTPAAARARPIKRRRVLQYDALHRRVIRLAQVRRQGARVRR